jgi:hypothetical protein
MDKLSLLPVIKAQTKGFNFAQYRIHHNLTNHHRRVHKLTHCFQEGIYCLEGLWKASVFKDRGVSGFAVLPVGQ